MDILKNKAKYWLVKVYKESTHHVLPLIVKCKLFLDFTKF